MMSKMLVSISALAALTACGGGADESAPVVQLSATQSVFLSQRAALAELAPPITAPAAIVRAPIRSASGADASDESDRAMDAVLRSLNTRGASAIVSDAYPGSANTGTSAGIGAGTGTGTVEQVDEVVNRVDYEQSYSMEMNRRHEEANPAAKDAETAPADPSTAIPNCYLESIDVGGECNKSSGTAP